MWIVIVVVGVGESVMDSFVYCFYCLLHVFYLLVYHLELAQLFIITIITIRYSIAFVVVGRYA